MSARLLLSSLQLAGAGCSATETLHAVRSSADEVKTAARNVSAAVAPLPDALAEAQALLAELRETNRQSQQTLRELQALAAHWRGLTPDGEPTDWSRKINWVWTALAGIVAAVGWAVRFTAFDLARLAIARLTRNRKLKERIARYE